MDDAGLEAEVFAELRLLRSRALIVHWSVAVPLLGRRCRGESGQSVVAWPTANLHRFGRIWQPIKVMFATRK
jgi:hypothetical protein